MEMEAHQRGLDENGERDYDYGGAVHGQQLVPLPAAGGVGAASAILNRAERVMSQRQVQVRAQKAKCGTLKSLIERKADDCDDLEHHMAQLSLECSALEDTLVQVREQMHQQPERLLASQDIIGTQRDELHRRDAAAAWLSRVLESERDKEARWALVAEEAGLQHRRIAEASSELDEARRTARAKLARLGTELLRLKDEELGLQREAVQAQADATAKERTAKRMQAEMATFETAASELETDRAALAAEVGAIEQAQGAVAAEVVTLESFSVVKIAQEKLRFTVGAASLSGKHVAAMRAQWRALDKKKAMEESVLRKRIDRLAKDRDRQDEQRRNTQERLAQEREAQERKAQEREVLEQQARQEAHERKVQERKVQERKVQERKVHEQEAQERKVQEQKAQELELERKREREREHRQEQEHEHEQEQEQERKQEQEERRRKLEHQRELELQLQRIQDKEKELTNAQRIKEVDGDLDRALNTSTPKRRKYATRSNSMSPPVAPAGIGIGASTSASASASASTNAASTPASLPAYQNRRTARRVPPPASKRRTATVATAKRRGNAKHGFVARKPSAGIAVQKATKAKLLSKSSSTFTTKRLTKKTKASTQPTTLDDVAPAAADKDAAFDLFDDDWMS